MATSFNMNGSNNSIQIRDKLLPLFQALEPLVAVWLFGSQATQKIRPDSDIDIAILTGQEFKPELMFMPELQSTIMQKLGRNDVDLVLLNTAPPFLCHRVFQDGIMIYESNKAKRVLFEAFATSKYMDMQPFFKKVYSYAH